MQLVVRQSPETQRMNRINSVNEKTEIGELFTILTETQIIDDLQKIIHSGGNLPYLAIVYLFIQYIGGNELIQTSISEDTNPRNFHQLNVKDILTFVSQNHPLIVSSIIQRLRSLYQSPEVFERTKDFGNISNQNTAITRDRIEGVFTQ